MNTDDKNIESLSREQLAEKLKENRDEQTDDIGDEVGEEWQPDCYRLGPVDDYFKDINDSNDDDDDDEYMMCYDIGPPDDWSVPENE